MFFHFETQQERLVHTQIHVDMIIPEYITRYFHEVITQEKTKICIEYSSMSSMLAHWLPTVVYASPTYICQNVCWFTKKQKAEKS